MCHRSDKDTTKYVSEAALVMAVFLASLGDWKLLLPAPAVDGCYWGIFFHLWTLNLIVAVWNTAIDCCMKFENIITFILTIICSQYLCNWGSEEERVEQWTGVVDNCAIYFTDSSLASKVISGELHSGGVSQWKRVISLRECERVPWLCNFSQHFINIGWCLFSFSSVDQKEAVN